MMAVVKFERHIFERKNHQIISTKETNKELIKF